MSDKMDIRSYLNPYPPRFTEAGQVEALTGALYKEDKTGAIIDALIRSVREGNIVEVTHGFLLAPMHGKPAKRRRELLARIDRIKDRGGSLLEVSTGRKSGNRSECNAMLLDAYDMIASSGRGKKSAANGALSKGRPEKDYTPEQMDAMRRIWFSRRYRTRTEAVAAIHGLGIRVGRTYLYSKFGKPDENGPEPIDASKVQRSPKPKRQFVYFAKVGATVKIGHSHSPQDRLKGLATGHHDTMELLATLPGGRKREMSLHKRFAKFHIRGEWFELSPQIVAYLKGVKRRKVTRKK